MSSQGLLEAGFSCWNWGHLYDPGAGGKGENVCRACLSCSAENHSEKLPLNTHPTSMG